MPFKIIKQNEMPPGGFKFFVASTGKWIPDRNPFSSKLELVRAVKAHLEANHQPVSAHLLDQIDEQLCQTLPPGWCEDEHHQTNNGWLLPFTFKQVWQFTGTLLSWWRDDNLRHVPIDEIKRRAAICALCEFNREPEGCKNCNKTSLMEDIGKWIVGTRGEWDSVLRSCIICGCALSLKTRIPTATLLKHMPEQQQQKLPAHCWIKQ